ncbi:MAG: SLC13/DASS family transporter [Planctomycetota bacterium]|nr:MAG: SLC13/DASS family transporter [Planctomycetota bacterium]
MGEAKAELDGGPGPVPLPGDAGEGSGAAADASADERTGRRPAGGRLWRLLLGPCLFGLMLLWGPGDDPRIGRMAGVAAWMAAWWVTEAVPIPATALLPLVLMPALGIAPVKEVGPNYGRSVIFLFLGGFLLALALQASGVHRRVALWILAAVGDRPRRLVLGFMLASASLSMWISNTATVMVLLPIALSVLAACPDRGGGAGRRRFGVAVMLGVAYAADIGGMATPVGTPPNLAYVRQLTLLFPTAPAPSFGEWMLLGLPLAAAFLGGGWLLLTRVALPLGSGALLGEGDAVAALRAELGPLRRDEVMSAGMFGLTALLWMTRGSARVPGWSRLGLFEPGYVDDACVAVATALLCFLIPSRDRPGERLLEWRMAREVPWGMLLLFGGGFALASGFKSSGLSAYVGRGLAELEGVPPLAVVFLVSSVLTLLTELTSNTATTEMVLPILGAAGVALRADPRLLMLPATLSASCAFMMPVASPTQAIVFASGWVSMKDMVRAGIWFNLLGVLLVTFFFWLLAGPAMGIDAAGLPPWAGR